MTDRIFAYTVLLESLIREDDAEEIENAIGMIKGIAEVVPQVANPGAYFAAAMVRREIGSKLLDILYPETLKN